MSNQKLSINQAIVVPELEASTQHVYVSESTMSEDGSQITVKLSYLADDPTLTGVGFSLNFDNSELSLDSVSGVAGGAVASGSLNSDGNGLTFAWSDPFGGSWPGSTEAELATITFNVAEDAAGLAALDIVKTSTPPGYAFDGQSYDVFSTDAESVSVPESIVTVPELVADTQHIYVSESTLSEDGTQVTIKLSYLTDDPTLTGVGFNLNFDSSALSLGSVSGVRAGSVADGALNGDGNGLVFAWSDPFGGSWPGATEAELATITFDVVEGTTGSTALNIVKTSTPPGYAFDGQSHEVVISAEVLPPLEVTTIAIDENSGAGQVIATVANKEDGETFDFASGDDTSVIVVPELQASTQHVYVSESTKSDDGTQVTVKLSYLVDDATLTGVGFNLNFDNSTLSLDSVSGVRAGSVADGALNGDGNGLVFAWSDPFGGSWPGATEAELATITFNVIEGATGSTALDIVKTSTPPGYEFDGQSHDVVITAGEVDPNLSIDPATGTVTLLVDPDFEAVSEYSFDITSSSDRSASGTSQINDVAPVITSGDTAAAIDENTGADQVVYTATSNEDATFSLSGADAAKFAIDTATGAVKLLEDPDAEIQDQYSFEVTATDAGGNASATQSVTLDIANVDEVAPTINSGDTATTLLENTGARQVVYTAIADDSADISGGVTFSLAGADADKFEIDSSSGEVLLITDPDADVNKGGQAQYNFEVVATDAAGHISAPKAVTLDITNVDDSDPIFVDGPAVNAGSIEETHVKDVLDYVPQVVYTANANDDADDVTSELSYSVSSNHGDIFSVDAAGNVSLNVAPDYESADLNLNEDEGGKFFSFTVTVVDGVGNDTDQVVKLYLTDVGEVAPTFTSDTSFSFDENNAVGHVIYTVTAVPDASVGGSIQYSLADDSDSVFTIDGLGNIMINESADYENDSKYAFAVKAEDDNGNYAFLSFSVSDGTITVNNLDEVAPTITSSGVADAINENSGADQVVYTAEADDSLDTSAGVTFSLDGADAGQFDINSTTGEVTLKDNPDFESKSNYSFTVIADDDANAPVEKTVTLAIINLDEIAPTITSAATADDLNGEDKLAQLDENVDASQVIYTATSDDSLDLPTEAPGPISYSLAAGHDDALSINSSTGEVTFSGPANHEDKAEYSFAVIATDSAGNASDAHTVTLTINDLDDAAPTVTSGASADAIDEANAAVEEDASGQVVYVATADDSGDDVADGPITFSLTDDSDPALNMNPVTGEVTLTANPDYESQSEYSFAVVATDAAGNASEALSVTLDIENLDELAPVYSAVNVTVLSSYSGTNQSIYTPNAADNTADVTSEPLSYSLSENSDSSLFSVDSETGEVIYIPEPVSTTTDGSDDNINFTVVVTDGSGNSTDIDLVLTIQANENNAPVVNAPDGKGVVNYDLLEEAKLIQNADSENPIYEDVVLAVVGSIDETTPAGVLYTASYTDDSAVTFSLSGSDADAFTVNADGEVSLKQQSDFEVQEQYNFVVTVTDASDNASSQSVRLLVRNQSVDENSDANQVVYTAATDFNPLGKADLSYSIQSDDSALVIDSATGVVTYLATPDYEASPTLNFFVIADGSLDDQPISVALPVSLNINNVDDSAPVFTSQSEVDAIDEADDQSQVIYTAEANDDGVVTYSLSDDSDSALSIDNGVVSLNEKPDHESQSSYSFTIVATDESGNQSRQSLTLDVNDKDEIAPLFLSSASAEIVENSDPQVIYNASAHSAVSHLEQGAISQEFVRNDDGTLTVKLFVDSEVRSDFTSGLIENAQFELHFEGQDGHLTVESVALPTDPFMPNYLVQNESGKVSFALGFTDPDNAIDEYKNPNDGAYDVNAGAAIAEITFNVANPDAVSNFVVSNVGLSEFYDGPAESDPGITLYEGSTAYQYEYSDGGKVVYSLRDTEGEGTGDFNLLDIDPVTGEVTFKGASSAADDSSADESTVTVPELADKTQHVYVSESTKSEDGTQVTVKLSYLTDDPTLTGVGFSLNFESSALSLDSVTGVRSGAIASGSLNADGNGLTFAWSDPFGGSWPGSTEAELATITFNVIEGATGSTALDIVKTSTPPGYAFDGQSHDVVISAEAAVSIDHESQSQYSFVVVATDESGNETPQAVTVSVKDLDEVAPSITSGDTANTIDENSGAGQVVYTATADDTADTSDGVSFSIAGVDADKFDIDASSGAVTLIGNPDADAQSQYSFEVVATDVAGNASAAQSVTLDINNLDDTAPEVTSADTANAIDENGAAQIVYTATADDSADISGGVTFSLADVTGPFSIDSASGDVTFAGGADHENQTEYTFEVIATDAAGNASAPQLVTMAINDLDDAAPVITSPVKALSWDENSGKDQIVYTAKADDTLDISDGVTFSLAGADADLLTIDNSGVVKLKDNLNFEDHELVKKGEENFDPENRVSRLSFSVVATDAANNVDTKNLVIEINNVDEESPVFTGSLKQDSVNENTGAETVIYKVSAFSDTDDMGLEDITFSLSGDDAKSFSISNDKGTRGEVRLLNDADYETKSEYNFTVNAEDASGNVSSEEVTLGVDPVTEVFVTYAGSNVMVSNVTILSNYKPMDRLANNQHEQEYEGYVNYDNFIGTPVKSDRASIAVAKDIENVAEYKSYVTTNDAQDIAKTAAEIFAAKAGGETLEGIGQDGDLQFDTADFNDDGQIGSRDAREIYSFVLGSGEIAPEWMFFDRSETEDTVSYTASLRGDVDGSWADEQDSADRLTSLEDQTAPIVPDAVSVVLDAGIVAGTVIYTATSKNEDNIASEAGKAVTYSIVDKPDNMIIDDKTGEITLTDNTQPGTTLITVQVADPYGNSADYDVELEVSAVPDTQDPEFSSSDTGSIDETDADNVVVYQAQASDDSEGAITYSFGEKTDPALSIDEVSGEVTLTKGPDHEALAAYSFSVIATDESGNSSVKKVVIDINDLDEYSPVITSGTVVTIDENTAAGSPIYTATAEDAGDIVVGENSEVTFSLTGDSSAMFTIDSDTGVVSLVESPDYENLIQHSFAVVATDTAGNESTSQPVTVNINNIDEVAPTIDDTAEVASIDENGEAQIIYTVSASDMVDTIDGVVTYALTEDSDPALSIDSITGDVSINAAADFETQELYSFGVIASDSAGNSSDPLSLTLGINDVDDAAPTIVFANSATELVENSGSGQAILTVLATDNNVLNQEGDVALSLAGDDAESFELDANGVVTLTDDPDNEAQNSYSFSVVATDENGNTSEMAHTLNVVDVDDAAPHFSSESKVSVLDNSDAGQLVYVNEASDSHDISEGDLSYKLRTENQDVPYLQGGVQSVFVSSEIVNPNLVPNQLEITVSYLADTNELPGLGLNIHFDSSQLSYVEMQEVLPKDLVFNGLESDDVSDKDGNAATDSFVSVGWASVDGDWTSTGLPEDLLTMVFDVVGDSGSTEIGFSASSTPIGYEFNGMAYNANTLSINEDSGDVTLNISPNYEVQSEFSFDVIATDTANNSAEHNVKLSVINVDDTDPTVISGDIAVSIDENSGGRLIYSAVVDDRADLAEGPITYSLSDNVHSAIVISSETGDVYLMENPDYETDSNYSFSVVATDSAGNEVKKTVNLAINNLDELAPVITNASDGAYAINENIGSGQVIFTASADDTADISNGVSYSLADGHDEALTIDSVSGAVTLLENPDYESQSEGYSFAVIATDAAGHASEKSFTVSINNLDEVAPEITSGGSDATFDENSGEGQPIYTASADDSGDISAGFTFSLGEDSDDGLVINQNTGVVTLLEDPDFETKSEYSFTVITTDVAGNTSDPVAVSIDINNLDEVAPVITSSSSVLVEAGAPLYDANAVDDADISAGVTFSLGEASDSALAIDPDSGVVTLNDGVSPNLQGYDFTVIASDGTNQSTQSVSALVYQTVSGSQPSTNDSSAIKQSFTYNADGTITLNLEFDAEQAGVALVENLDFKLEYGSGIDITHIKDSDEALLSFENDISNTVSVAQLYLASNDDGVWAGKDIDGVSLLQVTFNLDEDADAGFTLKDVLVNEDATLISSEDSSVTVAHYEGSDGDDIFELGGGFANVFTGEGIDTLIVTDQVDASVVVDFDPDSDKFDLTQLLNGDESVLGGSFDEETNVLTFSVDDIDVAEVTISDAHDFDEDDLSVVLTDFIA